MLSSIRTLMCALGIAMSAALVLTASNAAAQSVPSKCDAAKWNAVGSLGKCLATVQAKAAKAGGSVPSDDPAVAKCSSAFSKRCAKAETNTDCSKPGTCDQVLMVNQSNLDVCLGLIR